jgi:hypothetical protein
MSVPATPEGDAVTNCPKTIKISFTNNSNFTALVSTSAEAFLNAQSRTEYPLWIFIPARVPAPRVMELLLHKIATEPGKGGHDQGAVMILMQTTEPTQAAQITAALFAGEPIPANTILVEVEDFGLNSEAAKALDAAKALNHVLGFHWFNLMSPVATAATEMRSAVMASTVPCSFQRLLVAMYCMQMNYINAAVAPLRAAMDRRPLAWTQLLGDDGHDILQGLAGTASRVPAAIRRLLEQIPASQELLMTHHEQLRPYQALGVALEISWPTVCEVRELATTANALVQFGAFMVGDSRKQLTQYVPVADSGVRIGHSSSGMWFLMVPSGSLCEPSFSDTPNTAYKQLLGPVRIEDIHQSMRRFVENLSNTDHYVLGFPYYAITPLDVALWDEVAAATTALEMEDKQAPAVADGLTPPPKKKVAVYVIPE